MIKYNHVCSKYLLNISQLFILFILFLSNTIVFSNEPLITPYNILMKHYAVIGGLDRLKKQKRMYSSGSIKFAQLDGSFQYWSDGMSFYQKHEFPLFSYSEGDNGELLWSKDMNGKLLIHKDQETKKRRRIRKLLENFEHLNRDSKYFSLQYQGLKKAAGEVCHVVRLANTINQDISFFFFSQSSFYLIKKIIKEPFFEYHSFFDDFRQLDGMIYSFYKKTSILPSGKIIIEQTRQLNLKPIIPKNKFTIPDDIEDFYFTKAYKHKTTIPFLLVENNIYLPVTISGEVHYWLLDNGADMSIIDKEYAQKNGFRSDSQLRGIGINNLAEFSFVEVNNFQIPGLHFIMQKMLAYQGLKKRFYEPEIVGILGYDFLSRFITKIDYARQTLTFFHPEPFNYSGSGVIVNAPLQNKKFVFPVVFNKYIAGNYALDIGAFNTSLNYSFAEKHSLLKKNGLIRMSADIGGILLEKQLKAKTIELAGYTIFSELFSFSLSEGKGTNSNKEIAGFVGNNLLRHFILYLDYEKQQLIFEKGGNFNTLFPVDKSGMIIGRSIRKKAEVVYVAEDTPASEAGILSGDIIVSINGLKENLLPDIVAITKILRGRDGDFISLSIKRGDKIIDFKLTLRNLL